MTKRWHVVPCALSALLSLACATNIAVDSAANIGSSRLPGYIRGDADTKAERVIVFVHGIFGDGRTTWTNTTTGAYFPELLTADDAFAGASIWVHDFPSPKVAPSYSIDELADHLRRHLSHDNVLRNHRDVVFVAHSMGGLVVRAFLLKYRDLLAPGRVPILYFFSTPTTGADIASYTRLLSTNPQLGDMRKMLTNRSGVLATYDAQWSSSEYMRATRTF
ncbi:MAG TPA: alpha/beta fold hydrolase [Thermoanaerobaculia bacterium]|nr:alpha/beta fold hydrolase [Thermoanaerobaculia bacterium]